MKLILNSFFVAILCLLFTPSFASTNHDDSSNITSEEKMMNIAKDYKSTLKNMSKKEKKQQRKEIKKAIKDYKDNKDAGTNTLLLVIVAILLPPLAMGIYEGGLTTRFWLSLLLTLLFYLPGLIYTLVVILGGA